MAEVADRTQHPADGKVRRADVRPAVVGITLAVLATFGAFLGSVSLMDDRWQGVRSAAGAVSAVPQAARMRARQEIELRFRQGVAMLHMKQYDHALTAFHRVLQLDPTLPEAHVNAGFALLGQGNPALARSFFQSAIDLRSDQLNAYWGLAQALEAEGDLEQAVGALRVYAHLSPEDDPFRRKAWAALWEWESRLKDTRGPAASPSAAPPPAAGR